MTCSMAYGIPDWSFIRMIILQVQCGKMLQRDLTIRDIPVSRPEHQARLVADHLRLYYQSKFCLRRIPRRLCTMPCPSSPSTEGMESSSDSSPEWSASSASTARIIEGFTATSPSRTGSGAISGKPDTSGVVTTVVCAVMGLATDALVTTAGAGGSDGGVPPRGGGGVPPGVGCRGEGGVAPPRRPKPPSNALKPMPSMVNTARIM